MKKWLRLTWDSTQQQATNAQQLQKQGAEARTTLRKYADALAGRIGLDPHIAVAPGPLKELTSIHSKAVRHGGEVKTICDACRVRILFNSPEQIQKLRDVVVSGHNSDPFNKSQGEKGIFVTEIEDNYLRPKDHGYVGLHLKVRVPLKNGGHHTCEIQFMHEQMQRTYNDTHDMYKEAMSIKSHPGGTDGTLTQQQEEMVSDLMATIKMAYDQDIERLGLHVLREDYMPAKKRAANTSYKQAPYIGLELATA